MATVKIFENAMVLTSSLKYEDIELVQRVRPKALALFDDEEKKCERFRIMVDSGKVDPRDISENGVVFRAATRDGGYACVTASIPPYEGDVREFVADMLCTTLMNLNELEENVHHVVDDIKAQKRNALDSIRVI